MVENTQSPRPRHALRPDRRLRLRCLAEQAREVRLLPAELLRQAHAGRQYAAKPHADLELWLGSKHFHPADHAIMPDIIHGRRAEVAGQ